MSSRRSPVQILLHSVSAMRRGPRHAQGVMDRPWLTAAALVAFVLCTPFGPGAGAAWRGDGESAGGGTVVWVGPPLGRWNVPEHWFTGSGEPPRVPGAGETATIGPSNTVRLVESAPTVADIRLLHGRSGNRLHVDGGSIQSDSAWVGRSGTGSAELLVTAGSFTTGLMRVGNVFAPDGAASLVVTGGVFQAATLRLQSAAEFFVGEGGTAWVGVINDLVTPSDGAIRLEGVVAAFHVPDLDLYINGSLETRGRLSLGGESIHMKVIIPPFVPIADQPVLLTPTVRVRGGIQLGGRLTVPADRELTVDPVDQWFGVSVLSSGSPAHLRVDGTLDTLGGIVLGAAGGALDGTGVIKGPINFGGVIQPGRRLEVGTLGLQGAVGTLPSTVLELDVAGVAAGMADQLQVVPAETSGITLMGGHLSVRPIAGYRPEFGDVVRVVEWPEGTEIQGDFSGLLVPWILDLPDGMYPTWSIGERGVDVLFRAGTHPCPPDLVGDGIVDMQDLVVLLSEWGRTTAHADFDGDGAVGLGDLLRMLAAFGPCSSP